MCANPEYSLELSQLLIENISNNQTFDQLLLNGADINAQNKTGWCVLFESICLHNNNIRNYIRNGINLNIRDAKGRNALFWAIYSNNMEAVQLLLSYNVDLNIALNEQLHIFHYAVYKNNMELVEVLLNSGIDVNEKDSLYSIPLIYAVLYGKVDIAHYLIENGADKFLVDSFGNCAYSLAQELKVESKMKLEI